MPKDRILKIVGVISDEIVDKYKLYNYRNETIVQSLDLYKHIENLKDKFGLNVIVAINRYNTDTEREIEFIQDNLKEKGNQEI